MSQDTQQESVLAQGFFYKDKHQNAPDFVLGNLSLNAADAIKFITDHTNDRGYVNLQILRSKEGKPYIKLDTFVPDSSRAVSTEANSVSTSDEVSPEPEGDGLPF